MQHALRTLPAEREWRAPAKERERERSSQIGVKTQGRVRTRRVYLAFLLVLFLLSALLFLVAALNVTISQKGYRLRQLEEEIHREKKAQESLRLEVAKLESPARIERIARQNLGMILPSVTELVGAGGKGVLSKGP